MADLYKSVDVSGNENQIQEESRVGEKVKSPELPKQGKIR